MKNKLLTFLKHITNYGGIYTFISGLYVLLFWVFPHKITGDDFWEAILTIHSTIIVIAWLIYGIHKWVDYIHEKDLEKLDQYEKRLMEQYEKIKQKHK